MKPENRLTARGQKEGASLVDVGVVSGEEYCSNYCSNYCATFILWLLVD